MKLATILCVLLSFSLFYCFSPNASPSQTLINDPKDQQLVQKVAMALQEYHVAPKTMNDEASKEIFEQYLHTLDPEKSLFTQTDIQVLEAYQFQLDEAWQTANLDYFEASHQLLLKNVQRAEKYCFQAIERIQHFDEAEVFETDNKKREYVSNQVALGERWTKMAKLALLESLWRDDQFNKTSISPTNLKKAKSLIKKQFTNEFSQIKNNTKKSYLTQYINTFLQYHDAQSKYLPPKEKEAWDQAYEQSLVGIGARLELDHAYPKVTELIIGAPSWKSQQLQVGDQILKVKDQQGNWIETISLSLDQVIAYLKGATGTTASLLIHRANQPHQEIQIERGEMELDFAMSFLLQSKSPSLPVGYLRLPRFYGGSKSCAADVLSEIEALQRHPIAGIIFDVRNNIGGSSREAIEIIGYFLEAGKVMQIQRKDHDLYAHSDEDGIAQYQDDLIVLTNPRSGSASELLAGNIQAYNRGLIVGGAATFGKGSMQNFIPIDLNIDGKETNFGNIKLSVGRFFTASGQSPQYEGIKSDIMLPNNYTYILSGERAMPNTLPAFHLPIETPKQLVKQVKNKAQLQAKSKARKAQNSRFKLADQKAKWMQKQQENTSISLNLSAFVAHKQATIAQQKAFEPIFSPIEDFEVQITASLSRNADSTKLLKKQVWLKRIKQDPYIYECFQIMQDMHS